RWWRRLPPERCPPPHKPAGTATRRSSAACPPAGDVPASSGAARSCAQLSAHPRAFALRVGVIQLGELARRRGEQPDLAPAAELVEHPGLPLAARYHLAVAGLHTVRG